MYDAAATTEIPDRCELQHRVFSSLGDVHFLRSATDGVPMMALRLGEREAHMPLDALRRELAIGKDSADGRMLDLIGSALDFVACLQPGDRLPPEIRTGEASWQPSPNHLRIALTRLQLDLVAWLSPNSRWAKASRDETNLLRLADDPALREEVKAVAIQAAMQLAMADNREVVRTLEELSHELAYIEALRERLLGRVVSLCRRVGQLLQSRARPPVSFDTLSQVHRLVIVAVKQIVNRFDDVDAQTGEVGSLLRNVDNQRSFIRSNRDWLYQSQRAWEPVLDRWSQAGDVATQDIGTLLAGTYQFLAPRFMPTSAWHRPRQDRSGAAATNRMRW